MAAKKAASKKTASEAKAAPKKAASKPNVSEQYFEMLKGADPLKGDKDPAIVEWCRENMSADEFEAKYKDRGIS